MPDNDVTEFKRILTERAWEAHAAGNAVAAHTYWEILQLTSEHLTKVQPTKASPIMRLSDLYNADIRAKDPVAMKLAAETTIPHPLNNVQYADGISLCRHAKKHSQFDLCKQEVRNSVPITDTKEAPVVLNIHTARPGDKFVLEGKTFTVHLISPAGSGGRSFSGPIIGAQLRPGGYGTTIDEQTPGVEWIQPEAQVETETETGAA